MNRKIITSTVRSLLFSAGEVTLIWFAVNGSVGAGRLVMFLAGFFVITTPLIIAASAFSKDEEVKPKWVRGYVGICDTVCTILLVWNGWFWCGVSYAVGLFVTQIWYQRKPRKEKKDEQA